MTNRFYIEQNGASWCVRDREIRISIGPMRGQPHIVEWFGDKARAEQEAQKLNSTRGHASEEPRCVRCGKQPAGPADSESPMCASCHSLLAD